MYFSQKRTMIPSISPQRCNSYFLGEQIVVIFQFTFPWPLTASCYIWCMITIILSQYPFIFYPTLFISKNPFKWVSLMKFLFWEMCFLGHLQNQQFNSSKKENLYFFSFLSCLFLDITLSLWIISLISHVIISPYLTC